MLIWSDNYAKKLQNFSNTFEDNMSKNGTADLI